MTTPTTAELIAALKTDEALRDAVAEEINSLPSGEDLSRLADLAAVIVRSHMLGALADARATDSAEPEWRRSLGHAADLDRADWHSLGEALLIAVGTTGGIP